MVLRTAKSPTTSQGSSKRSFDSKGGNDDRTCARRAGQAQRDPDMLRGASRFTAICRCRACCTWRSCAASTPTPIRGIDTETATRMPGVVRGSPALTWRARSCRYPACGYPAARRATSRHTPMGMPGAGSVLAIDKVRFAGDPVAAVVAETATQAHDALQAILVDYRPLPVVMDAEEAIQEGAPQAARRSAQQPQRLHPLRRPRRDREGHRHSRGDVNAQHPHPAPSTAPSNRAALGYYGRGHR